MREIKFRGYNRFFKKWYYGSLVNFNDFHQIIIRDDGFRFDTPIDKDSIGQYTGFKDKNGKEIYEGDIVYDEMDTYINRAEVYFDPELGAWIAHEEREEGVDSDFRLYSINGKVEVIGNIYEEKLKESK